MYLKLVGRGEPIRLTTNRARDDSPAWSPDGREIAFLRRLPHSDTTVDATSLSLSGAGRLVYVEQYRDSNLERVNLTMRASGPSAAVVAPSTYDEHDSPTTSPR